MAKFGLDEFIIEWFGKQLEQGPSFEFEWDEGNLYKNKNKHDVYCSEIEGAFEDEDFLLLGKQYQPPVINEDRFGCLGRFNNKLLFVVFTLRGRKIRPIHARKANQQEKKTYESTKR